MEENKVEDSESAQAEPAVNKEPAVNEAVAEPEKFSNERISSKDRIYSVEAHKIKLGMLPPHPKKPTEQKDPEPVFEVEANEASGISPPATGQDEDKEDSEAEPVPDATNETAKDPDASEDDEKAPVFAGHEIGRLSAARLETAGSESEPADGASEADYDDGRFSTRVEVGSSVADYHDLDISEESKEHLERVREEVDEEERASPALVGSDMRSDLSESGGAASSAIATAGSASTLRSIPSEVHNLPIKNLKQSLLVIKQIEVKLLDAETALDRLVTESERAINLEEEEEGLSRQPEKQPSPRKEPAKDECTGELTAIEKEVLLKLVRKRVSGARAQVAGIQKSLQPPGLTSEDLAAVDRPITPGEAISEARDIVSHDEGELRLLERTLERLQKDYGQAMEEAERLRGEARRHEIQQTLQSAKLQQLQATLKEAQDHAAEAERRANEERQNAAELAKMLPASAQDVPAESGQLPPDSPFATKAHPTNMGLLSPLEFQGKGIKSKPGKAVKQKDKNNAVRDKERVIKGYVKETEDARMHSERMDRLADRMQREIEQLHEANSHLAEERAEITKRLRYQEDKEKREIKRITSEHSNTLADIRHAFDVDMRGMKREWTKERSELKHDLNRLKVELRNADRRTEDTVGTLPRLPIPQRTPRRRKSESARHTAAGSQSARQ